MLDFSNDEEGNIAKERFRAAGANERGQDLPLSVVSEAMLIDDPCDAAMVTSISWTTDFRDLLSRDPSKNPPVWWDVCPNTFASEADSHPRLSAVLRDGWKEFQDRVVVVPRFYTRRN